MHKQGEKGQFLNKEWRIRFLPNKNCAGKHASNIFCPSEMECQESHSVGDREAVDGRLMGWREVWLNVVIRQFNHSSTMLKREKKEKRRIQMKGWEREEQSRQTGSNKKFWQGAQRTSSFSGGERSPLCSASAERTRGICRLGDGEPLKGSGAGRVGGSHWKWLNESTTLLTRREKKRVVVISKEK